MQNELKPCINPTCSDSLPLLEQGICGRWVECKTCGMRGPEMYAEEAAVEKWNSLSRPSPQPVAGLVEALDPERHYIDLFRLEQEGGTNAARARRVAKYVAHEIAQALTAPAPDVTDAMVEATAKAIYEEKCFNPLLIGSGRSEWLGMDCDARLHRKAIRLAKAALAAQSKPEPQPAPDVTDAMVKAVNVLAQAEAHCRNCHDYYGGGHNKTRRACDKMRKAVDRLRQLLIDNEAALAAQDGSA